MGQTPKSGSGRGINEALRLDSYDTDVSTRFCDMRDCAMEAEHRAPKSPGRLNDYFWFCLEHVRAYNKSWNFYANMSEEELEGAIRWATTWERPSWRFGTRRNDGRAYDPSRFRDDFGLFDEGGPGAPNGAQQERRKSNSPEASAAALMGLTLPLTMDELKTRYKELAKLNHPDRNGGDKEAEERLKLINEAYTTLRRFLT
ncbi:MAG: J domain-containing protein [Alphaproteobacteria bacterium]|nr:J domain-containing protein [Alphaproteobacteria bacterium]